MHTCLTSSPTGSPISESNPGYQSRKGRTTSHIQRKLKHGSNNVLVFSRTSSRQSSPGQRSRSPSPLDFLSDSSDDDITAPITAPPILHDLARYVKSAKERPEPYKRTNPNIIERLCGEECSGCNNSKLDNPGSFQDKARLARRIKSLSPEARAQAAIAIGANVEWRRARAVAAALQIDAIVQHKKFMYLTLESEAKAYVSAILEPSETSIEALANCTASELDDREKCSVAAYQLELESFTIVDKELDNTESSTLPRVQTKTTLAVVLALSVELQGIPPSLMTDIFLSLNSYVLQQKSWRGAPHGSSVFFVVPTYFVIYVQTYQSGDQSAVPADQHPPSKAVTLDRFDRSRGTTILNYFGFQILRRRLNFRARTWSGLSPVGGWGFWLWPASAVSDEQTIKTRRVDDRVKYKQYHPPYLGAMQLRPETLVLNHSVMEYLSSSAGKRILTDEVDGRRMRAWCQKRNCNHRRRTVSEIDRQTDSVSYGYLQSLSTFKVWESKYFGMVTGRSLLRMLEPLITRKFDAYDNGSLIMIGACNRSEIGFHSKLDVEPGHISDESNLAVPLNRLNSKLFRGQPRVGMTVTSQIARLEFAAEFKFYTRLSFFNSTVTVSSSRRGSLLSQLHSTDSELFTKSIFEMDQWAQGGGWYPGHDGSWSSNHLQPPQLSPPLDTNIQATDADPLASGLAASTAPHMYQGFSSREPAGGSQYQPLFSVTPERNIVSHGDSNPHLQEHAGGGNPSLQPGLQFHTEGRFYQAIRSSLDHSSSAPGQNVLQAASAPSQASVNFTSFEPIQTQESRTQSSLSGLGAHVAGAPEPEPETSQPSTQETFLPIPSLLVDDMKKDASARMVSSLFNQSLFPSTQKVNELAKSALKDAATVYVNNKQELKSWRLKEGQTTLSQLKGTIKKLHTKSRDYAEGFVAGGYGLSFEMFKNAAEIVPSQCGLSEMFKDATDIAPSRQAYTLRLLSNSGFLDMFVQRVAENGQLQWFRVPFAHSGVIGMVEYMLVDQQFRRHVAFDSPDWESRLMNVIALAATLCRWVVRRYSVNGWFGDNGLYTLEHESYYVELKTRMITLSGSDEILFFSTTGGRSGIVIPNTSNETAGLFYLTIRAQVT
ncbi:hypothetical protein C8R48DRAFT_669327 [Suillus tomentosus]|nr:hypothetical protein C8R48DRAFT_669327 [Suillus tomentosus]